MIKEINTFQTADGKMFERMSDAEDHETLLKLKDDVAAFWREHACYTEIDLTVRELIDICVNNVDQLRTALGSD